MVCAGDTGPEETLPQRVVRAGDVVRAGCTELEEREAGTDRNGTAVTYICVCARSRVRA